MHETLRITSIFLLPFMPSKATEILDVLGIPANERTWEEGKRLGTAEGVAMALGRYTKVGYKELWPALEDLRNNDSE